MYFWMTDRRWVFVSDIDGKLFDEDQFVQRFEMNND